MNQPTSPDPPCDPQPPKDRRREKLSAPTLADRQNEPNSDRRVNRRRVLKVLAGLGIGTVAFQRALAAQVEASGSITAEMVEQAEWIAGLSLSDKERQTAAEALQATCRKFEAVRGVALDYTVDPALRFSAAPGRTSDADASGGRERGPAAVEPIEWVAGKRPESDDDLAFLPLTELAALVRDGAISSVELTNLYLKRLRQYDPALKCVVTLTEELALEQAHRADREIAAGRYRGPLHGIPWGAKDLISWPGYKTTWGAGPYCEQTLDEKATVARRLEEAGAVLVAKLALGALAWGDEWFGGMTRNPWNVREGSSGSSAGSASAVAAGLVGFALGSETLGSIVSPCTRCGATGLRPTFGRVSRYGCMPLAWSMDKIGPIARSVEDCALVFAAMHGADGLDATAIDRPFHWPPKRDIRTLKVGYFDEDVRPESRPEILVLSDLGVKLVPISLPDEIPASALTTILNVEAAASFDELTRQGISDGIGRWADVFPQAQFTPAVEYLRANRVRTLLMRKMEEMMEGVDAYLDGDDLVITNLTGHPTVVLPNGLVERDDALVPTSITFTGRLFGESDLLALAHAYQQATGHHLRRPPMQDLRPQGA